jgi:hypothetical protein
VTKTKMRNWTGVEVAESQRDVWVEHVRKDLENSQESSYHMSGNAMVCGYLYPNGEYEIFDCVVRRVWSSEVEGAKEDEDMNDVLHDYALDDERSPFSE